MTSRVRTRLTPLLTRPKVLMLPYYFSMINAATFFGFYHALTSRRVYKEAMPHERAKQIIIASRGSHVVSTAWTDDVGR